MKYYNLRKEGANLLAEKGEKGRKRGKGRAGKGKKEGEKDGGKHSPRTHVHVHVHVHAPTMRHGPWPYRAYGHVDIMSPYRTIM